MNIHKHQKSIQELLQESTRISGGKTKSTRKTFFPGCYIIARTLEKNLFKLGCAYGAGGVYERIINQYKVCMPLKNSEFI